MCIGSRAWTTTWPAVTRNLLTAAGQGDLIVRHLLLPGHSDCCFRPIVAWVKANLPVAKFSVRDGYLGSDNHWNRNVR